MSRQEFSRSKSKNATRHQRTLADPKVKARVDALRSEWADLDFIERGERLRELIECGCSTRGLGETLDISGTTVRRFMKLAALPEAEREAVRGGSSAKKILEQKAKEDRLTRRQERIGLDARTGELSDRLADTILAFCRTVDECPVRQYEEQFLVTFLSEVRNECWKLESTGFRPPKLLKRHSMEERFRLTRPPVSSDLEINHSIEWLAILILAEVPESPIWENAIEKAGPRAKEIRPIDNRTLPQKYLDEAERKRRVSEGPPPRRY